MAVKSRDKVETLPCFFTDVAVAAPVVVELREAICDMARECMGEKPGMCVS